MGELTRQYPLLNNFLRRRPMLKFSLQLIFNHAPFELLLMRSQRRAQVRVLGEDVALAKLFLGRTLLEVLLKLIRRHGLFEFCRPAVSLRRTKGSGRGKCEAAYRAAFGELQGCLAAECGAARGLWPLGGAGELGPRG